MLNGTDFSQVSIEKVTPVIGKTVLIINVSPTGGGTVSGSGYYSPGTNVNISATPNTGFQFLKWSDGNTNQTRTILIGETDISITAFFSRQGFILDKSSMLGTFGYIRIVPQGSSAQPTWTLVADLETPVGVAVSTVRLHILTNPQGTDNVQTLPFTAGLEYEIDKWYNNTKTVLGQHTLTSQEIQQDYADISIQSTIFNQNEYLCLSGPSSYIPVVGDTSETPLISSGTYTNPSDMINKPYRMMLSYK